MKDLLALVASVATVCFAGTCLGQTESYWIPLIGDFEDPASWTGPVPDDTVTAIFDLDEKSGPFIRFNADEVSSRAIIRAGTVYFMMWDTVKDDYVSWAYELMNPSFNLPSLIVAENPGDVASLNISEGFLTTRSLVVGQGPGLPSTVL